MTLSAPLAAHREPRTHAHSAAPAVTLTESQFAALRAFIHTRTGITLSHAKRELLNARFSRQASLAGVASAGPLVDRILANPEGDAAQQLFESISTHLTGFFREPHHFEHLRSVVLPGCVARAARTGQRRLRLWSAGCSTGEEAYTLAMTVSAALPEVASWDVKILANDLNRRVLNVARAGEYDADRLESVPPDIRRAAFDAAPAAQGRARCCMKSQLRSMIVFRQLNLVQAWPFNGQFDVIFCRNVMIYFDRETQERLIGRLHERLLPGGRLFTGHSESLMGIEHGLKYVQPTVYARAA